MSEFPDMSGAFEIDAPAKTNLWLRIVGKRDDGYHEIETRMVRLSLADRLRLKWRDDDAVALRCSDSGLPTGEENLAVKAVRALEARTEKRFAVSIELDKKIPSGAGLGGGSSDAAAVLRALNEMACLFLPESELAEVGATIGSDIPFFVYNRACDCAGRGEIVAPLEPSPPPVPVFLIKPPFEISAAWAYRRYADSSEHEGFHYRPQRFSGGEMVNHLERPVFEKFPLLGEMKVWLLGQPEVESCLLSGSGSTMISFLKSGVFGEDLRERSLARYGSTCWTWLGTTA